MVQELQDRFDQQEILPPVVALESVAITAANGEDFTDSLESLEKSCYKDDFDFSALKSHMTMLPDIVREAYPKVRKVTSICTVCEAMNSNRTYKLLASEVHKLLKLYLTVPITSSTSERTFSVMKRLLTYLRSTMSEKRLNNCVLLHIHKDITYIEQHGHCKRIYFFKTDRLSFFGSLDF